MTAQRFDLIVIGAGPAGSTVAERANEQGYSVALVERRFLGGTCLNFGCDPTKTLLYTAELLHEARRSAPRGLRIPTAELDWLAAQDHVHDVLNTMRGGERPEARRLMRERGIHLFEGEGRFLSDREIEVNGEILRGERILISTGTTPLVPPIPGLQETGYLTNESALFMPELPARLVVVGGGPIGVEFAQMFSRFGVAVTLVEMLPTILPRDDAELARELTSILTEEGITILTGNRLTRVEKGANGKALTLEDEEGRQSTLVTDELLMAIGRAPALGALALENAGVARSEKGWVKVNNRLQTNVPHIFAAGDILGSYQFTHFADKQGSYLARTLFADEPEPFRAPLVPWVTYTSPEMAHAGKTEEELQSEGVDYIVSRLRFENMPRAMTTGKTQGLVKILADREGKLLGGHILAHGASELIGTVVLALYTGLTVQDIDQVIMPYPTMVEAVGWALEGARPNEETTVPAA